MLEQLAFNAQQIRGSRDPGHAPFEKNCKGLFLDCPWEYACQMWSPVSLTELEQLVFNAQKLGYHVTLATPLFEKISGHFWTVPRNMFVEI